MTAVLNEVKRLDECPEYIEAVTLLNRLRNDKRELEAEIETHRLKKQGTAKLDAEIQQLLAGRPLATVATDHQIAEDFAQLSHRRHVLACAIEQQERTVAEIGARLSLEIATDLVPEYKTRVQRQLAAMIELAEAGAEVWSLLQELEAGSVSYSAVLRPVQYGRLGRFDAENSLLSQHVFELMREKILSDDELDEAGVPSGVISNLRRRLSQR